MVASRRAMTLSSTPARMREIIARQTRLTVVGGLGGGDQVGADLFLELGPDRLHRIDPVLALRGVELNDFAAPGFQYLFLIIHGF